MGKIIFISMLTVIFFVFSSKAENVSGDVGGTWTVSNHPYYVQGNVTVPSDSALTIEPGVEVRFQGNYNFLVQGLLEASGTSSDSILFVKDLPAHADWGGIDFWFANGLSVLSYCRIENSNDGGIEITGCSPTIQHCLILNNRNSGWGGGIYITNSISSPLVDNCTFLNDSSSIRGGGIAVDEAVPTISNNIISNNGAVDHGGGIELSGITSAMTIEKNTIIGNTASLYGGGIRAVSCTGNIDIIGNVITTNSGIFGGGIYTVNAENISIINNLIYDNQATADGGGVSIRGGGVHNITNNVIYNNSARNGGGIETHDLGDATVTNCILWANTATTSGDQISGSVTVTYSDVEGGTSGTGNIDILPNFIEASSNNFRLVYNSPCVDTASTSGSPTTDFDENPTNQDGNNTTNTSEYDMGAFELLQATNNYSSSGNQNFSINTFETGSSNTIADVNISSLSSSGDVSVYCYTKSMPIDPPSGSKAVQRFYYINEGAGLSYGSAILKLYYSQAEFDQSAILSESNLSLYHYQGGDWNNYGGVWSNTAEGGSVEISSLTDLSGYWAFSDINDSPLPVNLVSFKLNLTKSGIEVIWETSVEINNDGFEVWKQSPTNDDFIKISDYKNNENLIGLGNSSGGKAYKYIDKYFDTGCTYSYKIVSVDVNGSRHEYKPVSITIEIEHVEDIVESNPYQFSLSPNYPNPFNPTTNFDLIVAEQSSIVFEVFNLLGQRVYKEEKRFGPGMTNLIWNAENFAGGIYFYNIHIFTFNVDNNQTKNIVKSGKMILVK